MKKIIAVLIIIISFFSLGFIDSSSAFIKIRHSFDEVYITNLTSEKITGLGFKFDEPENKKTEDIYNWDLSLSMNYTDYINLKPLKNLKNKTGKFFVKTESDKTYEAEISFGNRISAEINFIGNGDDKKLTVYSINGEITERILDVELIDEAEKILYVDYSLIADSLLDSKNGRYEYNKSFNLKPSDYSHFFPYHIASKINPNKSYGKKTKLNISESLSHMNLIISIATQSSNKLDGNPAIIYKFDDINAKYKIILSDDGKTIVVEKH